MNVKEYLLHLNQVKEDRIRLRVWVLICLQRINDERISDSEEVNIRKKLNDCGVNSSSSSSSCGGGSSARRELDGVLAEEKITAFEMWREMLMYV